MNKQEILTRANELAIKDSNLTLTVKENREYTKLLETIMNNDWEDEFWKMD